jgi:hypothetical protein
MLLVSSSEILCLIAMLLNFELVSRFIPAAVLVLSIVVSQDWKIWAFSMVHSVIYTTLKRILKGCITYGESQLISVIGTASFIDFTGILVDTVIKVDLDSFQGKF